MEVFVLFVIKKKKRKEKKSVSVIPSYAIK